MKEWIRDIAIAVVIALAILAFIKPTIVKETSMENTLHSNDYVFVSKQAYKIFGDPEVGDIIVFKSDIEGANGKNKLLIKRVIGLPGDTISISAGLVYRNGEALDEPYTKDGFTTGDAGEKTVPEGYLYVLGDNRIVSLDSRYDEVGFIDIDDVVGKAFFRLYPFSSMGRLN